MTLRVNLWCSPRTISTALMYSFAQRDDTTVVDEPLYAHYLRVTPADRYHPGAADVLASQDPNGASVVRNVILGPYDSDVVLFKQMTHHLVDLDLGFLAETTNVLLTRDPADMLRSYSVVVDAPTAADTGYPQSAALLDRLRLLGQDPIVLDSTRTLEGPESVLRQLCARLAIPFDAAMLEWEPGPRPEDGVWAQHWYASVHESSGFGPPRDRTDPFPRSLEPLLEEVRPHYERLAAAALTP